MSQHDTLTQALQQIADMADGPTLRLVMAPAIAAAALSATQPAQAAQGEPSGSEVRHQVFALCEDTENAEVSANSVDSQTAQDFMRGRKFEAKQIRRAIGTWFVDETNARAQQSAAVQVAPEAYAKGIEAAASLLTRMADEYAAEHGHDDLGSLSFGSGPRAEAKMEWHSSLIELADEIRRIDGASPTPPAQPAVAQGAGFDSDAPLYTQPAVGADAMDAKRWQLRCETLHALYPSAPSDYELDAAIDAAIAASGRRE